MSEWKYTEDSYYHIHQFKNQAYYNAKRLVSKEIAFQMSSNAYYKTFMTMPETTVTLKDLPSLKKQYIQAVKDGKEFFKYKEGELVTSYAKYLIEYLQMQKDASRT